MALVVLVLGALGLFWQKPWQTIGSVPTSESYIATSTKNFNGTAMASINVLKATDGQLGKVVITGAGAGQINLWNATTSNVNLRTGNKASSTILLATIPVSAAAQEFEFDAQFTDGLLYELIGTAPTSTITYK